MEHTILHSSIEAILFSSDKPVAVERIREAIQDDSVTDEILREALVAIRSRLESPEHGIELRESQGGFYFVTKPENAEIVRRFFAAKPFRLGRSALEVLAIVAYRQPISRAEIDQIRGIDSSHLMRTLMERGLVKMTGKADAPGRPVQYGTTPRFLETIGLNDVASLPPLSELEQIQGHTEDPMKRLEAGLERFVQDPAYRQGELQLQSEDGLGEIDALLQNAGDPDREVYASQAHREVAEENVAAHKAFLEFFKPVRRRRKADVEAQDAVVSDSVPADPVVADVVTAEGAPQESGSEMATDFAAAAEGTPAAILDAPDSSETKSTEPVE